MNALTRTARFALPRYDKPSFVWEDVEVMQRNDALWRFSRLGIASFQRMLRFLKGFQP